MTSRTSPQSGAAAQLRQAMLSDIGSIAQFQTECWREAYRDLVPKAYLDRVSVQDREVRWRDRLGSGARKIALAESGNALIGVVSWGEPDTSDAPAPELMSLYVAAGHRGSGVASDLMYLAIGAAPAHLWVFEKNPPGPKPSMPSTGSSSTGIAKSTTTQASGKGGSSAADPAGSHARLTGRTMTGRMGGHAPSSVARSVSEMAGVGIGTDAQGVNTTAGRTVLPPLFAVLTEVANPRCQRLIRVVAEAEAGQVHHAHVVPLT